MRQRVAAGLLVVAIALAGAALGQGSAVPEARGNRCELKVEGIAPAELRLDGEESPLVVTHESGVVKGYVYTPAAYVTARQVCTGTAPSGVLWRSWQGSRHLEAVQFSDGETKVHVYDRDPIGSRTWKGPTDVAGVTFEELVVDIRFGTFIEQIAAAEPQGDGSTRGRYLALKYSPDAKSLIPYPGAAVTVDRRCGDGEWNEFAQLTADDTGEFTVTTEPDCELRGTIADAPDAWGVPVDLTT